MTKAILPLVPATDVVLMGAGIMSATLGTILKELNPALTIQVFERLDEAGTESSDAWNNAGTGHAAFCELNYTPERGSTVDGSKAMKISESFEISREFWAYLVEKKYISSPSSFISKVPHISFVWGEANVNFLKARYAVLKENPLFRQMEITEDPDRIADWAPLIMRGRASTKHVAATRMDIGTDVDFGALTRQMF